MEPIKQTVGSIGQLANNAREFATQNVQNMFNGIKKFADDRANEIQQRANGFGSEQRTYNTASVTHARCANPVAELSLLPQEVQSVVSDVSVYVVANNKGEHVLLSGTQSTQGGGESDDQGGAEGSQRTPPKVSLLFLEKDAAEKLKQTVVSAHVESGKNCHVKQIPLSHVYNMMKQNKQNSGSDQQVTFRLIPNQQEVQNAIKLYNDAGVPAQSFTGVPLFQAAGLTIMTDKKPLLPIFLSKSDLDIALGKATGASSAAQVKELEQRSDAAANAAERALQEHSESGKTGQVNKQRLADDAARYMAEADATAQQAKQVQSLDNMKIEVGSLEEVMCLMDRDTRGDWLNIQLIPPGALTQQATLNDAKTKK